MVYTALLASARQLTDNVSTSSSTCSNCPSTSSTDYVPCTTPLNMSITLDGRGEIPLHPLDLTAEPLDSPTSGTCVGTIQASDSTFSNPTSNVGDMILGVPFLRNTY